MATKSKVSKSAGVSKATSSNSSFSSQFQALAKIFHIEDQKVVHGFLAQHEDLPPILKELHTALRSIFRDEQLRIELFEDPDGSDGLELVVAVVGAPKTELQRLGQFDQLWWHNNRRRIKDRLCVNLRFN